MAESSKKVTFAVEMKRLLFIRCMIAAVMLLAMSELVMADDGERMGLYIINGQ